MKMFVPLIALLLLSGVTHGGSNECTLNDLLSLSTLFKSMATSILESAKITCIDIRGSGALASCPESYTPTSCACGMGCGSWDIQSETTCHCQCNKIDWTTARCCKVVSK